MTPEQISERLLVLREAVEDRARVKNDPRDLEWIVEELDDILDQMEDAK